MSFFKIHDNKKAQAMVEYALLLVFIVFIMIVILYHPYIYNKFRLDILQVENMILHFINRY